MMSKSKKQMSKTRLVTSMAFGLSAGCSIFWSACWRKASRAGLHLCCDASSLAASVLFHSALELAVPLARWVEMIPARLFKLFVFLLVLTGFVTGFHLRQFPSPQPIFSLELLLRVCLRSESGKLLSLPDLPYPFAERNPLRRMIEVSRQRSLAGWFFAFTRLLSAARCLYHAVLIRSELLPCVS
jgi:hypothetical protein